MLCSRAVSIYALYCAVYVAMLGARAQGAAGTGAAVALVCACVASCSFAHSLGGVCSPC